MFLTEDKKMKNELESLVEISRYYGNNPEFVIAGGGNTSFKNKDFMWIKASGTSLAAITEKGFAKMNRACLAQIAVKTYSKDPLKRESEIISELFKCVEDNSGLRPSVETSLHNLLNYSFVVHTHPTLVNGLMCSKNSQKETKTIFGENVLIVEYTDPGYILFKLIEKRIKEFVSQHGKEPQIIFLENHGVFVSANSTAEIREIYSDIMVRIKKKLAKSIPSHELTKKNFSLAQEIQSINKSLFTHSYQSDLIKEFTKSREDFSLVATAFSPDNIVYCKAHYLFTKNDVIILKNDFRNFITKHGYFPRVIGVENEGVICLDESESSLNTVIEVFTDILKISYLTKNFGGPRFMTPEQIEFIDSWEVENYRRKVAKAI